MPAAHGASSNNTTHHGPSLTRQRAARQLLAGGATSVALGVLLSLGAATGLGGIAFVGGLAAMLLGLHKLGRLGPG